MLESARTTKGLPVGEAERLWIQEIAGEALSVLTQMEACKKRLEKMALQHAEMKKYVKAVGAVTLCVIWATAGDPRNYGSSGAFLKALGLNLKEISSGKRQGELAISKRGPSLARKWLYFWALRGIRMPELKDWYDVFKQEGKRAKGKSSKYRKMKGVIALMRKLCRSLWYAMRFDLEFDYNLVFPGKPLEQRAHVGSRFRHCQGRGERTFAPARQKGPPFTFAINRPRASQCRADVMAKAKGLSGTHLEKSFEYERRQWNGRTRK